MESRNTKRAACGIPRLSCGHGCCGAAPRRVHLTPRMLEVEALPDLMDVDLTRSEDSGCAAERLFLSGRVSQLSMSRSIQTARADGTRWGTSATPATTIGRQGIPERLTIALCSAFRIRTHCSRQDRESLLLTPMLLTCSARSRECASQALSSGDDWIGGIAY